MGNFEKLTDIVGGLMYGSKSVTKEYRNIDVSEIRELSQHWNSINNNSIETQSTNIATIFKDCGYTVEVINGCFRISN